VPEATTASKIIGVINEMLGSEVPQDAVDAELEDELGLDSIHRAELASRLSQMFGLSVGVDELDRAETVAELAAVIDSARVNPSS
jgi:acyl carrier protein